MGGQRRGELVVRGAETEGNGRTHFPTCSQCLHTSTPSPLIGRQSPCALTMNFITQSASCIAFPTLYASTPHLHTPKPFPFSPPTRARTRASSTNPSLHCLPTSPPDPTPPHPHLHTFTPSPQLHTHHWLHHPVSLLCLLQRRPRCQQHAIEKSGDLSQRSGSVCLQGG